MSQTTSAAQRAGLIAFGGLLALVAAELALRALGVGGPVELPTIFDRVEVQYYPDASELNPWVGADETETLRVAFVGDSFTVGETNGWDDAYPWRLQRLLNMNGDVPPAAVRVFARKGTATLDQLPLLEEALDWRPDLLVLGLFLNDPEDPHDPDRDLWRERSLPRQPGGFERRALGASRLASWIYLRLELRRVRRALAEHMEHMYDPESTGWGRFERALSRFDERSRQQGVPLVALIFPAMGGLASADTYPNAWAHQRLRAELDERRIPHLDLLDTFLGTADARLAAFPELDAHPSEIGHRIAARAIFEWLLDEGHVADAYRPKNTRLERRDWLALYRRMWRPVGP